MSSGDDANDENAPKGANKAKRRPPGLSPRSRDRISRVPKPVRKPVPGTKNASDAKKPKASQRPRRGTDPGIGSQSESSDKAASASAKPVSTPSKKPRPKVATRSGAPVTLPRPQRTPAPDSAISKRAISKSAKEFPADLEADTESESEDLDIEVDINLDSLETPDPDLVAATVVDQRPAGLHDAIPETKETRLPEHVAADKGTAAEPCSPFDEEDEQDVGAGKPKLSAEDLAAIFARPTDKQEAAAKAKGSADGLLRPVATTVPPPRKSKQVFWAIGALCIAAVGGAVMHSVLDPAPSTVPIADSANPLPEDPGTGADTPTEPEAAPEPEATPEPDSADDPLAAGEGEADSADEEEERPTPDSADTPARPSERATGRERPTPNTPRGDRPPQDPRERAASMGTQSPGFSAPGQQRETGSRPTPPAERAAPSPMTTAMAPATAGLSRGQVRAGMQAIQGRVRACGNGQSGQATVSVRISPSGRVAHARVTGYFASRPEGSCIARAVRSAQFPSFSGEHMTIRYQFAL